MDNTFLAYLELRKDVFFHNIPKQAILTYLQQALAVGRAAAEQYRGYDEAELCRLLGGICVIDKQSPPAALRATLKMTKPQPTICLYQQTLMTLAVENDISFQQVKAAALLHELFHLLEERSLAAAQQLPQMTTFQLGPFKRQSTIRQAREIAAHAFVQARLDLPELPNVWDYHWSELEQPEADLNQAYQEFRRIIETKESVKKNSSTGKTQLSG